MSFYWKQAILKLFSLSRIETRSHTQMQHERWWKLWAVFALWSESFSIMLMQLFRRFPAIDSRCKVCFVFWLVHWVTCICCDWPERNRLDLGKHKGRFQFDEKSRFEFLKLLVTNGTTERQFSGISEKGTTYRGKSKLSEISYQEFLFHWTSLRNFRKFRMNGWFAFRNFNNFRIFRRH